MLPRERDDPVDRGSHPLLVALDDEAEPVSHLQHFRSFQIAEDAARHLARTKGLDLIHEASPA